MRILSKNEETTEKKQKTTIPDGTYRVRITKVEEKSRATVENGKKPYAGIKLYVQYVSPKYKDYFSPTVMIFMNVDSDGPYIKTGSQFDKWMKILSGLNDYTSYDIQKLKGKECLIKVETPKREGVKNYTNVVAIFKAEDNKEQKPVEQTEVRKQEPVAVASKPVVAKDEFTSDDDLEPVSVSDDEDL